MKSRLGIVLMGIACVVLVTSTAGAQEWTFKRGDTNGDGNLALIDALILLNFIFALGETPPCLDAPDFDDDGNLELVDGLDILTYIFLMGPPPLAPFPECGIDPNPDSLTCAGPLDNCPPAGPNPPSALNGFATSHTEIELEWVDNSPDETGFEIERSLDGVAGPYLPLDTAPADATSYSDTNLSATTEYCYRVRAVNDAGTSGFTNPICVTTQDLPPPGSPTNLAALPVSDGEIQLTWDDNSAAETGFEIERSTSGPGGPFVALITVGENVTAYGDRGLAASTQYCYRVRGVNNAGTSGFSNISCATTEDPPPPAPPSNLQAVAISETGINLTWQDNSGDEEIFQIERSEAGPNGPFALLANLGANTTALSDLNLQPSSEYCYRIRASHVTPSEYSNVDCDTTFTPPPPAAPTNLVATGLSPTEVALTWQDNSPNETGFQVERSTSGLGGPYTLLATLGPGSTQLSDNGLTPATQYCYRVRAVHNFGVSGYSNLNCATTTQPPPPAAPSNLQAAAISESQVDLLWQDLSNDETGFEIGRSQSGVGGPFVLIATVGANITFFQNAGLSSSIEYCYRVRAVHDFGASSFSNVDCATPPAPPLPATPTNVSACVVSHERINLFWDDVSTNETGFDIERAVAGGVFVRLATAGEDMTAFVDTNLAPATEYCYRMRAVNDTAASLYSSIDCVTTDDPPPPTAPDGLVLSTPSEIQMNLLWQDNSNNESGFDIERSVSGSGGPYVLIASVGANTTSYFDKRLSPGTEYCYRVRAFNANGDSSFTPGECRDTPNPPSAPVAPSALSATAFEQQVEVTWSDNSANENSFDVERSVDGPLGTFVPIVTVMPSATSYTDLGLAPDVQYCYRVRAVNTGGSSISNTDCATTTASQGNEDPPDSPSSTNAVASSESVINVSWVDNSDNESLFQIERSTDGATGPFACMAIVGAGVTGFADTGLSPNTTFWYRVRAGNPTGVSAFSNVASESTFNDPQPAPPTNLKVWVMATDEIILTWDDNSDNETGFEIRRSISGGGFSVLTTTAPNQQVYVDSNLTADIQHCYRVLAVNGGESSSLTPNTCRFTAASSVQQRVMLDTGVVEVSDTGPYFPGGFHGNVEFQTHVPLPDFDWTNPVDYTGGRMQLRLEVAERTTLELFCAKQFIQERVPFGDHWWGDNPDVIEPNIYLRDHPIQSMNDATGILETLDDPPLIRMVFAAGCVDGNPSSVNTAWTDGRIFPMDCRFTWVLTEGLKFIGWDAIVGAQRPLIQPLGLPFVVAYPGPLTVRISTATEGGEVRYTLNGSTPNASSTLYTGPFQLSNTTTVKAKTFAPGIANSTTSTTVFVID